MSLSKIAGKLFSTQLTRVFSDGRKAVTFQRGGETVTQLFRRDGSKYVERVKSIKRMQVGNKVVLRRVENGKSTLSKDSQYVFGRGKVTDRVYDSQHNLLGKRIEYTTWGTDKSAQHPHYYYLCLFDKSVTKVTQNKAVRRNFYSTADAYTLLRYNSNPFEKLKPKLYLKSKEILPPDCDIPKVY